MTVNSREAGRFVNDDWVGESQLMLNEKRWGGEKQMMGALLRCRQHMRGSFTKEFLSFP